MQGRLIHVLIFYFLFIINLLSNSKYGHGFSNEWDCSIYYDYWCELDIFSFDNYCMNPLFEECTTSRSSDKIFPNLVAAVNGTARHGSRPGREVALSMSTMVRLSTHVPLLCCPLGDRSWVAWLCQRRTRRQSAHPGPRVYSLRTVKSRIACRLKCACSELSVCVCDRSD